MLKTNIYAHYSGELYIQKAMLIANPESVVTIHASTSALIDTWRSAASKQHQDVLRLLSERYGRPFATEEDASIYLRPRLQQAAEDMRDFLTAGIPYPDTTQRGNKTRVNIVPDGSAVKFPGDPVRYSTAAAIKPFKEDRDSAQKALHDAMREAVPDTVREGVKNFYDKHFSTAESYVLLWGRTSGRTNAALPHLDTNSVMLGQMMQRIQARDPSRKLVLIGDPVALPSIIDNSAVPHPDVNLVRYWETNGWPGNDLSSQMYFLSLVQAQNPNTISIGTNSGILELPHLLGLRTIYLESEHDRNMKAKRWEKKWELGNIGRLQTSAATELQGRKAILFEEVREWVRENGLSIPGAWPTDEEALLRQLIDLASTDEHEHPQPNAPRPFSSLLHTAQQTWADLRSGSNDLFVSSVADRSVRDMNASLAADGLTTAELDRFEVLWDAAVGEHHMQNALLNYEQAQRDLPASLHLPDTSDLQPPDA